MLAAAAVSLLLVGELPGFSLVVALASAASAFSIAAQTAVVALQYFLFFILQDRDGPGYVSLLGAVGTLVGVPMAIFLIGEVAPFGLLAGDALIAVGVCLITRSGPAAALSKEASPGCPPVARLRKSGARSRSALPMLKRPFAEQPGDVEVA